VSDEITRRLQTISVLLSPLTVNAHEQCKIVSVLRENISLSRDETEALNTKLSAMRHEAAKDFDRLLAYLLENYHGDADRQQFKDARSRDMFDIQVFSELPQSLIPLLVTSHLLFNLRLKLPHQDVTLWPAFTERYGSVILDIG
jgi:hypothetical protein